MGFRVILIENEVAISIKLNNLVIHKEERDIWIPVDDINLLVIDNMKITMTARILSFLAEQNVGVMFCNKEHLPIGFYSSYDNHSRVSKMLRYQLNLKKEFYDTLWREIVKKKISNQKKVLQLLSKDEEIVDSLMVFEGEVQLGDITNREAHAAKVYFNELMGCSFSRGNEDILLNSGLDYGYAIFRSYIAKMCVGYGLNTQLGIHHKNEYNRFNLVDDLIEPFRPIVDYYAYSLLDGEEYFKGEHRKKLINILNHRIIYNDKNMYICNVLEEYVSNIAAIISGKDKQIIFPDVTLYQGDEDEI